MPTKKLITQLIRVTAKMSIAEFIPSGSLSALISHLIDEVLQQEKALDSIAHMLNVQMASPFDTGVHFLREAAYIHNKPYEQTEFIKKARDEFIRVSHVDVPDYPLVSIKAQFYVGVCYDLLNQKSSALRWYEYTHQKVVENKQIYLGMHESAKLAGIWEIVSGQKQKNQEISETILPKLKKFEKGLVRLLKHIEPRLKEHQGSVNSVTFSPDGSLLVSGSSDKTIILWDVKRRKKLHVFTGHSKRVNCVTFSPDGSLLASSSNDKTIILWDVKRRKKLHAFTGHSKRVNCVAFSPDGSLLASSSNDKTIILWNAKSRKKKYKLAEHTDNVNSVAFSPDGLLLASGADDYSLRLWDLSSCKLHLSFEQRSYYVQSVTFSPNGSLIAAGLDEGEIVLKNLKTGNQYMLAGPIDTDNTYSVAISPCGKLLSCGSDVGKVKLWDTLNRQRPQELQGHKGKVRSVAFSPNGQILASASKDRTIKLWNLEYREVHMKMSPENTPIPLKNLI